MLHFDDQGIILGLWSTCQEPSLPSKSATPCTSAKSPSSREGGIRQTKMPLLLSVPLKAWTGVLRPRREQQDALLREGVKNDRFWASFANHGDNFAPVAYESSAVPYLSRQTENAGF